MALPDLTGEKVNDTYQRLLQKSSNGQIVDGTDENAIHVARLLDKQLTEN